MARMARAAVGVGIGFLIAGVSNAPRIVAGGQHPAQPLRIEDYYRLQTVGGVAMSPDGQTVTFTVSTRVEATNGSTVESYVVPADGSAPPRRAAPAKTEAPAPGTVSPDGKWRVILRDTPRPRPAAPPASDFERRHAERFKGAIFDWMEFQRDGQPFPAPDPAARPAQQIVLQPLGGAESEKVLFDEDLRPTGIVWHPGNAMVAFTADPSWREETKYDHPNLWTVTTDGRVTRVTEDGYVYSDVDFSPDGKYMSYARSFGTDMVIAQKLNHGGPRDLFVRPVDGRGGPVNLTASWDLEPGNSSWSPDGRHLYFTAATGGESHLFRVAVPGAGAAGAAPVARVEQVTTGERRLNGLVIDRGFTTIAYTVGVHDAPADVYAAKIDGTGERRLSNVHTAIKDDVVFGRTERLRWKSYDGTPIEGWITLPPGYDRARGPYPLVVVSHGGPHAATGYAFDFKKQFFAANGYVVLDTNFRSSTGYGEAFKWATWGEWGRKDGEDVVSGIDHVLRTYAGRSRAGRAHGPFLRRVHDELAHHAVSRSLRGGHCRRGHHELDQRLRHGGHLSDEGDGVLRHAVGRGREESDDQAVAADPCRAA